MLSAVIPFLGSRLEKWGVLWTPAATLGISRILKVSSNTKCFCIGDTSSSELDENYRYSAIMIDRVHLHKWFTVQHTLFIDMNPCHVYTGGSVQHANVYQVSCEMGSLKLVPEVLWYHAGSWTSIVHLGTSILEMWLYGYNNSFVENVYKYIFIISL